MPIKTQNDLPVKEILERENIFVMDENRASHQNIRQLEIAIVNLMPLKEDTELQILRSLSNTPIQVNVTFVTTSTHIFTVASGRSIPMFRKKAALVPVNAPCILYNGGACYDYRTDELLFAFPLADDASQLLQALRDHCPNERTEVQTLDCHYAYGDDPRRDAALAANGVPVQHEAVLPPQPWIKLAVYGTSKQVGYDDPANTPPEEIAYFDELQRYTAGLVGDRYAITRALPRNMEISAGGCDKGTAARRLADTLGRSILVCVGDAPNDLAMLQAADYGFRTGDCDPAMRRYDFRDAAPSAEGSVASVIDALRALL